MTRTVAVAVLLALAFAVGRVTAAPRSGLATPSVSGGRAAQTSEAVAPARFGAPSSPAPTDPTALPADHAGDGMPVVVPADDAPAPKATVPAGLVGIRMTWYCLRGVSRCSYGYAADCPCVAVSPDLSWLRGRTFEIVLGVKRLSVRAVDCNCQARDAIDAYASVFAHFAPLSVGVLAVEVVL